MTTGVGPPRIRVPRVELRRIAMPLVTPFRTSFGSQTDRDILLVRVELADQRQDVVLPVVERDDDRRRREGRCRRRGWTPHR